MADTGIENLLHENRLFPPSASFAAAAVATQADYDEADADYVAYWTRQAKERLTWFKEPTETLDESNAPFYTWFADGELNVSYNCLDRHLATGGDKVAYHWVGEPGDTRTITYQQLSDEVNRFANGLRSLGVGKGDQVAIYMGMVPELPIAMLACARIGAPHSVVFGGFSADAIVDRVDDAQAKLLITCDGAWRRGTVVPLKDNCDDAMARAASLEHCVVVKRTDHGVDMKEGRDIWWHDLVEGQSTDAEPEVMNAEDLLYLLYTSGTTAKPKGIMHTTAGYLTGVATTHAQVFDLKPESDVYWCAADVGWVTGHSYIVYGPLTNHTTSVMYEGTPDFPDKDRLWSIIAEYGVTILYTAPTAIRAFMKWGSQYPERHDLSSLRLLGTVGEPINPEAWMWYHTYIGAERCPIVDTWWQTETGGIMISPLPGVTATKPGSATKAIPGISADVVDGGGNSVPLGNGGFLTITKPWPAMLRSIFGDDQRYIDTYWSEYPGVYFPGDGAKIDEDGYLWVLGRVDDVMNVSGHRISTMEIESALVSHPAVAEAAVIGATDDLSGQAIAAFVTLRGGFDESDELLVELKGHVAEKIGAIARPKTIIFTPDLPKTRSGKIMRRLLRDISDKRALGDVTTLANADVVEAITEQAASYADDD
ncbi:MAG: acetate--CoA ligase [Armatimonadetes bacterium]|nr:MAG: acetate--CoA ligase [Armatimonadota bacterium]